MLQTQPGSKFKFILHVHRQANCCYETCFWKFFERILLTLRHLQSFVVAFIEQVQNIEKSKASVSRLHRVSPSTAGVYAPVKHICLHAGCTRNKDSYRVKHLLRRPQDENITKNHLFQPLFVKVMRKPFPRGVIPSKTKQMCHCYLKSNAIGQKSMNSDSRNLGVLAFCISLLTKPQQNNLSV